MNIIFCGDIMPGGVLPYQDEYLSSEIKKYLKSFDLIIGTLETAIGTNIPFDEIKMAGRKNIIYSRNEDFYRIKEIGVNIVSLANNHIGDLGIEGLKNTIKILNENNICYCGAGSNIEEASKPIIIEHDGVKIAILAYCSTDSNQVAYVPVATKDTWGVNPFIIENVCQDIKQYKSKCDYVVVMVHWGKEYSAFPLRTIKRDSIKMSQCGANIIIGAHTHCVQPHIKYKNSHIYYSLGNFLFPDFYMSPPRPLYYPQKEDVTNIKTTYAYPYPITEPLKRVWKSFSRVGLVVEVEISKKLHVSNKYVLLDSNNVLRTYKNLRLAIKLTLIGFLVKLPFYNQLRSVTKIIQIFVGLKNKLKKS